MGEVDRRDFLKGAGLVGATAVAPSEANALAPRDGSVMAREPAKRLPDAVGMLYDSALCIGCKACVAACKSANEMPPETPPSLLAWNEHTWDTAEDLSGRTRNVIKVYRDGTAEVKDREKDGFAFVKRHCLHCVDPSCVSVCPVSAMVKDPVTGIVTYDPSACIGCRYCVFACPFGVPQYDFMNPLGKVNKCEMCVHLQKQGKTPACCDVCPTGASLFGKVTDLSQEIERRFAAVPGSDYAFPRGRLGDDRPPNQATIPAYVRGVYGEHEVGGTQVRYLSAVPFEKLGLEPLPSQSPAALAEGVQHKIYHWLIAPIVAFAGLAWLVRRRTADKHDEAPNTERG